ncbi:hypothetical protein EK904_005426, partial [Melospiza melodia maxima]
MEEQVQQEVPSAQHTGGHYPMQEGEVFNTRYQVLHKLGCGTFATVWLCQDMRRKKQVAVKVLKSREGFAESAQDEVAFLRCVLAGLHFLHKCCRIIHADIKPENILLCGRSKRLQRLLMATLHCDQGTGGRLKGAGGDLGNQLEESDLMSIEVKIADLGSACWTYKPFSKEIQTQPYRALEVLLGLDYGTPADIWSTACLAFEMATGECLFDPQPGKYFSRDDDHVARIIELLGRIPPQIVFSWNKSTKFFSRPGLKQEQRYVLVLRDKNVQ